MYIRGKQVTLAILRGETYLPFICATDCAIDINTDTVETRTIGDGIWSKPRGKRKSYSISLTGLIELDDTTNPVAIWLIENYDMQMLPVPVRMIFYDPSADKQKIFTGDVLITRSNLVGVSVGFATSSFNMAGYGAPTITTALTCEASITSALIGADPEHPGETQVTYEVQNTVRIEYNIDDGGNVAIFDPGDSGVFYITGLADGVHALNIFAICENGAIGDMVQITFESVDGEPGDYCAPINALNQLTITATSARYSWFRFPAPADGYGYELINRNTNLVVQQGTQTDDEILFTGLTPGTPYRVRIYAICEIGVSVSAPVSDDFDTASESCNVPGAPVMSDITDTTATGTWTPASPAPADGYEWRVLSGVTLINSGTVFGTTVDLTALPEATNLTLQVRSACGSGQFSDWISTNFSTTGGADTVTWSMLRFPSSNTPLEFTVNKNAGLEVQAFNTSSGSFSFVGGDEIQAFWTGPALSNSYYMRITNETTGVIIFEDSQTEGFDSGLIALTGGNTYSITAQIMPT